MLTFYFNILFETKFLTTEQYIELLTFDRIQYTRNITIQNKTYASLDKNPQNTANKNQPVQRMTETSSFMSLLRAKLVANSHFFPYMDSEPGTPNR